MAMTLPRTDVFTASKFVTQSFKLMDRQELSRQANGVTRGKDLGSALWMASWGTVSTEHVDAIDFEAIINSLSGVIHGFYAGDLRRPFPKMDPTGSILGSNTAKVHSVQSGVAWRLKGLPAGYVISRGDYLSYDYGAGPSRALVQCMETVTADISGVTPSFQVRAELRAGTLAEIVVTLKQPTGLFMLVPNGFDPRMDDLLQSSSTFQAVQRL